MTIECGADEDCILGKISMLGGRLLFKDTFPYKRPKDFQVPDHAIPYSGENTGTVSPLFLWEKVLQEGCGVQPLAQGQKFIGRMG